MIPEVGHFALLLALAVALVQGVLPIVGAARGRAPLVAVARPAAQVQFLMVAVAFACLTWAFVSNDFSVRYVAQHSNSALPLVYRVAAVWGGHEGSMLLWVLLLALWMLAVSFFSRRLPAQLVARILAVMSLVSAGLLLFALVTSNPFERLLPAAAEGRDLNPLLQDPGMVLHPPMLYMGYVGFAVPFAFCMAALLEGRLDVSWARWSRPWTTVAWSFLTLGIALGSYWAYYELGWGGWWFWDPVENASFMPWLIGTALMHSLAVTEKRGLFKAWSVLLAILAFALSLLGTFLVRSGVLTSVHAFATDPRRGVFILVLLAIVIGGSLALYAWRAPRTGAGGHFAWVSREAMLLANNILLAVAAGAVMLGTLYPLALDALGLGKLSVGAPYFEAVFVPLMLPALLLVGIGPLLRWRTGDGRACARSLAWPAAGSVAFGLGAPFAFGDWSAGASLGLGIACWVVCSAVRAMPRRLQDLSRAQLGMMLGHLGLGAFVLGAVVVKGYAVERDLRMEPGDTARVGAYVFRLDGIGEEPGPNYTALRATVSVTRDGRSVTVLHPEKRVYRVQRMPMTEAAIDTNPLRDLYVSLGESLGGEAWAVRIHHKPFVVWIWLGCVLMALGGLLAASDRRYALRLAAPERPAAAVAEGVRA